MKDDDLVIRVLIFAKNKIEFTMKELFDEINPNSEEEKILRNLISEKDLLNHNHSPGGLRKTTEPEKIFLHAGAKDYFRLLEFQQLKEARAASRTATWLAFGALIVSIVVGICSIYVSVDSMDRELKLPQKLYKTLKSLE